jgi:hypothetical protein
MAETPFTPSPHTGFIESALPVWYRFAKPDMRQAYVASTLREVQSSTAAQALLANVQTPASFCRPLLQAAVDSRFGKGFDVDALELVRLVRETLYPLSITRIKDPQRSTLLEAALQNFEPDEAAAGGLDDSVVLPASVALTLETEGPPTGGDQSPLDVYSRYTYPKYDARPIKAGEFAQLVRSLDLGRQYVDHIKTVLQPLVTGYDAVDNRQADIAATLLSNQRDRLEALAHVAMMKGNLSSSGYAAILQVCGPQYGTFSWEGYVLVTHRLFMMRSYLREGTELFGPLVFQQKDGSARCIVYMPDDPSYPLAEYSSFAVFARHLRRRLRVETYRQGFGRFVSREEVAAFATRLDNVLSPTPLGLFQVPAPDPKADLELVCLPLGARPMRILYDRVLALMLKDAQTLVVPTSAADRKAREARILEWVGREMLLLNVAAFFVPAVGAVMAVVGGLQLLKEIFTGIDDWQHGQTEEAVGHVFAVGENLLSLVVIGAGAAAVGSSGFVDSLVKVDGPLGKKLWNAELEIYRQPVRLPDHLLADEMGQYRFAGKTYIKIEGHFYEQYWDATLGKWRLRHPRNRNAYEPVLEHNGAGMWRSAAEDPEQWDTERLIKRLGYGAERFSTLQLQRIRLCSGLTEDQLRGLDPARETIPPLLADSIRRFAAERDLTALPSQIRQGGALAQQWLPAMLVRLPHWPQELAVTIETASKDIVYGSLPSGDGPRISVRQADLLQDQLLEKVLGQLDGTQTRLLLSDAVGSAMAAKVERLQDLLIETLDSQREYWFGQIDQASAQPMGVEAGLILKAFPGLTAELAQALFERASSLDVERLRAQQKVPLKIAEQAHLLLRELRLNRALQGLFLGVDVPHDSDVLLMKMAEQLPGWTGEVRVELREGGPAGRLIASLGPQDARTQRLVVREGARYQAFDAEGRELSAQDTSAATLLSSLPPAIRMRLGFAHYEGAKLHTALVQLAIASRAKAAAALGQVPAAGWMRAMVRQANGRVGYTLSGRWFWRSGTDRRLEALYPQMPAAERDALKVSLGADAAIALTRLETEYQVLGKSLLEWVEGWREASYADAHGQPQRVLRRHRQQVADRIAQAWKRETRRQTISPGRDAAYSLDLRGLRVGELPLLAARMEHINVLLMDDMALGRDPSAFLRAFPELEQLTLHNNPLTRLPEALSELQRLFDLRLNNCNLAGDAEVLAPLRNLPALARLQLSKSFNALTSEALLPLQSAPRLSQLLLTDVASGLDAGHVSVLARSNSLHTLSLARNQLVMTPALASDLAAMTRLRNLQLSDNPLGTMADISRLKRLDRLFLSNTQLTEWPAGLTELMSQRPMVLHHVALDGNPLASIPDISRLPFFGALRQFRRLYSFAISRLDLDAASIGRLEGIGILPLGGAGPGDLDVDMPETTLRSLEQLSELPEASLFLQAWRRIVQTRDYALDPIVVRKRAWNVLDALCKPLPGTDGLPAAALREQVFALGETEMTTCADGMALILSRWESLVLVEHVLYLPPADRLRELLRVSRGLFTVAMVDARAVAICGRRIARRMALNTAPAGQDFIASDDPQVILAAPALDPLDDLQDNDLAEPVDTVEVRLKLRIKLTKALDLPLQPASRLYGAQVSEVVVEAVKDAVRGDLNFDQMSGWLVDEPYWRRYLRQQHPDAFTANDEYWAQGFEYLYEISRDTPDADDIATVPHGIIATLRERYPDKAWTTADGTPQAVTLNATEQDDLEQWLRTARIEGEREPYRRLTEPLVRYLYPKYDD